VNSKILKTNSSLKNYNNFQQQLIQNQQEKLDMNFGGAADNNNYNNNNIAPSKISNLYTNFRKLKKKDTQRNEINNNINNNINIYTNESKIYKK
jgi:hypothetical protein